MMAIVEWFAALAYLALLWFISKTVLEVVSDAALAIVRKLREVL